jgi:hypothetical protein
MASQYGSLYGFARKLGQYRICTGCDDEIRNGRGFLIVSETQILPASGKMEHIDAMGNLDKFAPRNYTGNQTGNQTGN